jgi:hypothetical protein
MRGIKCEKIIVILKFIHMHETISRFLRMENLVYSYFVRLMAKHMWFNRELFVNIHDHIFF